MPVFKKISLYDFIAAILIYTGVIIYHGYQYGQGDQSQILPVLYEQDHPGTYVKDHYVKAYLNSGVNERTIFHFLLRHLGYGQPLIVFFWHAMAVIALFLALITIAGRFIQDYVLIWIAIALIMTLGYHTATGSNELYYNQFVPSVAAKAFGAWALYHWLEKNYAWWSILLILAGLLQPLVGLQLFIVTSGALLVNHLISHRQAPDDTVRKFPWLWLLVYCLVTVPWVYLLATHNGGRTSPDAFVRILEFRLPHHFFASSFRLTDLIFIVVFWMITVIFYKGKLKWMFILIGLGCVIYEAGAEIFHSTLILYTQWWKTTIWVEAFAVIALFAVLEKNIHKSEIFRKPGIWPLVIFIVLVSLYRFSGIFGPAPFFMAPLSYTANDALDISRRAKNLTGKDALFIIPPEITSFRWYAQRSAYADYKAMLHTETFLYTWYERMDYAYSYNMEVKKKGLNVFQQARKILGDPPQEKLNEWRLLGITHVISYSPEIITMRLLARNATYSLYEIPYRNR